MMMKYGANVMGYIILGLPMFGRRKTDYLKSTGQDFSSITKDYVRNMGLLLNLSKAIGRVVVSYKELQSLAGYTSLVYELKTVLDDLKRGKYKRQQVHDRTWNERGIIKDAEKILFDKVPIVSPNGDLLVEGLSLTIEDGMHTFI